MGEVIVRLLALQHAAEAEVQNLDLAFARDCDVGRLQIAVDNAFFMRRLQPCRNLAADLDRFLDRQRSLLEALRQRLAVHEFEHQESFSFCFFQTIDRRDVGMI